MKDKVFLDTNILVYCYSNSEPHKQSVARGLVIENNPIISTQVIQGLINTVTRKFKFTYTKAIDAVNECCKNNNLHTNTNNSIIQACQIAEPYRFSFYDSLIIAAALDAEYIVLYSEVGGNSFAQIKHYCKLETLNN